MTRPPYVCPGCGEVHEEVVEALSQVVQLSEDLQLIERDQRAKRRRITQLERERAAAVKNDPLYMAAMDVLEHWRATCNPNARELNGPRLENVLERLRHGYKPEHLKRACDGYRLQPYVVNGRRTHEGPKDAWRADAELIFRDATRVDQGLRIADRADDLREVMRENPAPSEVPGTLSGLSDKGRAAVKMARHGFAVFPCKPGEKHPATRHGFKDAKRDEAALTRYWTQVPEANVAIATGEVSGIIVLDIDTADRDDGEDGWATLTALEDRHGESLPDTLTVTTPRGGQHIYFQHPGVRIGNQAGAIGVGFDLRGDGGYVLAPPSEVDGKPYVVDEQAPIAPLPPWLRTVLVERQLKVDQALQGGDLEAYMREGAATGNRNTRLLAVVGSLVSRGYNGADAYTIASAMNAAYCDPPLPAKEVQAIVKSVITMQARKAS